MSDVQDLDVLVPEPKRVRFGGTEYGLPADIPMEIFLRINQAGKLKDEDGDPDQTRQVAALTDAIGDLFAWEIADRITPEQEQQIKDDVNRILRRRGVRYVFTLISTIYKEDEVDGEAVGEEDQAPLAEDSNGTKSSSTSRNLTSLPRPQERDSSA